MILGRVALLAVVAVLACARARTLAPAEAPAPGPVVAPPAVRPLVTTPGWLGAEPAPATHPLEARCALVASVLTFPGAPGNESVFEAASGRGLASSEGRILVAATVAGPPAGEERSWFTATESCGDRLLLVTPGKELPPAARLAVARLELVPVDSGAFAFRLRVSTLAGAPVAMAPSELVGRAERTRSTEWSIAAPGPPQRSPRRLDPAPRASHLARPLPPGRAEAAFQFDTGADIMGAHPKEAGLVVVVRYADRELRQTVASCPDPSRGSALGDDGAGDVLDLASCGDLFRLRSEPGAVRVEREDAGGVRSTVSRIEVGADRRAVRPLP